MVRWKNVVGRTTSYGGGGFVCGLDPDVFIPAANDSIMARNCCCDKAVAAANPAANCEAAVVACIAAAML